MADSNQTAFAHMVFFSLKDKSDDSREQFIAACHKYLSDHPGTLHYSAGGRATEYQRPVNDQAFDVALVVVFASEADHDRYQVSEKHKQFLAEQSENWSEVRVFDAFV